MILFGYAIAVLLMISLPVLAAVWLRRWVNAPWWLFLVGVLTFAGSQIYHTPLNKWLADIG